MIRQELDGLWAQLPSRDDKVTPQLRKCVRSAPGVSAPMFRVKKKSEWFLLHSTHQMLSKMSLVTHADLELQGKKLWEYSSSLAELTQCKSTKADKVRRCL